MPDQRVVLITGASSGVGQSTARLLSQKNLPEEVNAQFETNFFGVVRMVNAVLQVMRQQKRGHIINASSLSGVAQHPSVMNEEPE